MQLLRIAILVALVATASTARPDSFLVLPQDSQYSLGFEQGSSGEGVEAAEELLTEQGLFLKFQEGLDDAPWFCHGIDCPEYEVDTAFTAVEGVERRVYSSTKWASISVKGVAYDTAMYDGFMALFRYISGTNADSEKIPMTAPVRTKIVPAAGPTCENEFIISFFVPFAFQESTPAPTEEGVFLTEEEPFTVYVSTYGGFSGEKSVISHAAELSAALIEAGVDIVQDYYYSAGYDPPFRLLHRHNEVWVVEQGTTASDEFAGLQAQHEGQQSPKWVAADGHYEYFNLADSKIASVMLDEGKYQYDDMYYGDLGYGYYEYADYEDAEYGLDEYTYGEWDVLTDVYEDGYDGDVFSQDDYAEAFVLEVDDYPAGEMEEVVHVLEALLG